MALALGGLGVLALPARSAPSLATSVVLAAPKDELPARAAERAEVRSLHQASTILLQTTLRPRRGEPEWLMRETGSKPLVVVSRSDSRSRYLALQVDRLDGTDLLTVRQPIAAAENLHFYAGAGLGRAQYLDDDVLAKPLPRRRSRHDLAAAIEVGAQAQLGTQLSLDTSLRWLDLGREVTLLKSDYGPMRASEVMLGVTVGYSFR